MGESIPWYVFFTVFTVSLALFALSLFLCLCARKQKARAAPSASPALQQTPEVSGQPEHIQAEPFDETYYNIEDCKNKSRGILANN